MEDTSLFQRIERMNGLIRRKATGTPAQFAQRLSISQSTLFNYLNILKDELNAPIAYCRYRKTYYYKSEGNIVIGFTGQSKMVRTTL